MNTEQPLGDSTVSIEARAAAAMFGDPVPKTKPVQQESEAPVIEETETNEQEAVGDEAPQTPETFELELDGEKYVLPKKLEKGFLQEREFTQKSQNLSLKEKQIEHIQSQARVASFRAQFESEVAPEMDQLRAYDSVLSKPVDVSGLSEGEAAKLFFQRSQWKDEREAIARSIHQKHQQWAQKTDAALKELANKSEEIVRQRVPNWNADLWKAVSEHAKQEGYSDVELNSINDPRHKLTLWKAQQFDALKAKATKTVVDAKTVKTTPTNPMPQHVKDNLNFRKQLAKTAPGTPERNRTVEQRIGSLFAKR